MSIVNASIELTVYLLRSLNLALADIQNSFFNVNFLLIPSAQSAVLSHFVMNLSICHDMHSYGISPFGLCKNYEEEKNVYKLKRYFQLESELIGCVSSSCESIECQRTTSDTIAKPCIHLRQHKVPRNNGENTSIIVKENALRTDICLLG